MSDSRINALEPPFTTGALSIDVDSFFRGRPLGEGWSTSKADVGLVLYGDGEVGIGAVDGCRAVRIVLGRDQAADLYARLGRLLGVS